MHARAVERNTKLQAELDSAKAEIRQLKAERFGKQSEKQSATDRSNDLDDPQNPATSKKKRGQQPGRPAPKRRDYSHLSAREELIDLAGDAKICDCCGKPLADLGLTDAVEQIEIETIVYRRVISPQALPTNLRLLGSTPNRHRAAAAEGPAQEHLRHELVDASATGKVSLTAANAPRHRAASAVGTKPRAGNDR